MAGAAELARAAREQAGGVARRRADQAAQRDAALRLSRPPARGHDDRERRVIAAVSAVHASSEFSEVTELIQRWQAGDIAALDRLLPLVYADLRAMAVRRLAEHEGYATLQPTALVHDVFPRLFEAQRHEIESGPHLFNLAGRAMRQILIDRSRRAAADKRGGEWQREDFLEAMRLPISEQTDLGLIDEAISGLEEIDPRLARIVELRYFVGLSVPAVANALGVDERAVGAGQGLAARSSRILMVLEVPR